ncbi:MAG: metalloregulator ArsR/SmtB family transcription factor [Candidatus Pacearchaeota archaeon]|nr:metalloregulator ArsR/SmtB family transcription factor [Candidatus Pacearchaeota archaeon]
MINKTILKSCHSQGFQEEELYGAYKIFFGTLVSESRLKIINLLRKRKLNVGEIVEALGFDQTSVSHDLSRLKKCGFVISEIRGKYRNYGLNEDTIVPLMKIIEKHMGQYCVHILSEMKGGN